MSYDTDVPGTVLLIDLEGKLHVKHGSHNTVLVPQPSSDINDPLRWSQRKKRWQFGLLWMWAFLLAVSVNFMGPLFSEWTKVFDTTFGHLNISIALTMCFLGIGVVLLQPTALKLGRRFVYLICTVLVIIAMIVGSQAHMVGSVFAANAISGFAAAPVDSLVEISATDVFFIHERSTVFSFFVLSLYMGSNLGSLVSGFISASMGWRWCYYLQIIFFAVLLVICLFCLEDTSFRRDYQEIEGVAPSSESFTSPEKSDSEKPSEPAQNKKTTVAVDVASVDEESLSTTLKPYSQRMKLIHRDQNDPRSWITLVYRPFLLISFPAVVWGGIVYGAQMMWLSLISSSQSLLFSAPPYNFSVQAVGLTNLSPCIGSILGMFYGGKFVDWLTVWCAKRNNGYMEPEFRLWAMVLPLIMNAAGILGWGLGGGYAAPWPILTVTGSALLGFAMSSSAPICMTYVVDSYEKMGPECLVLMLFIRNMIGMGFTFAISPWMEKCGLKLTTWLMFMLSLVINGGFVVFLVWGKRLRKMTKDRFETYADPSFRFFGKY